MFTVYSPQPLESEYDVTEKNGSIVQMGWPLNFSKQFPQNSSSLKASGASVEGLSYAKASFIFAYNLLIHIQYRPFTT